MSLPQATPTPPLLNPVIREDVGEIIATVGPAISPLEGTTLLVTGGSGFLCSYVLDTIARLNDDVFRVPCQVVSVDNFRTGLPARLAHLAARSDFKFLEHDASTRLDLPGPVDWIIHGAGVGSPTFYRRFPLETIDVNVSGIRHMLDLARRHGSRGLLYLSTSEIYGDPDPGSIPTPEDYRGVVSCTGPRACYDESKRLGETLCAVYHERYSVPVKVVRPFNVYGPGQRLDDRRLVPDMISAALRREPLVLLSDGRATRSFCYISDAVAAMFVVLLKGANGQAYNIGNDEQEITIRELAEQMREAAGPPWLNIDLRRSEDPHYLTDNPQRRCPDLTKIRTQLGWSPKVTLSQGIQRTLRSYQASEGRPE